MVTQQRCWDVQGAGWVTYVCKTFAAIEAESLKTTVAKHLDDLSVLLTVLLEGQLTTLIVVLLGTPSPVLATLQK